MTSILLLLSGIFYAVLCIFSIVTGIIYMTGKKELNPIELSDSFMQRLSDEEKKKAFTKKMGLVTFIVGVAQGITSFAILKAGTKAFYGIALGFTIFSIASVSVKLKGKVNAFPIIKFVFYMAILVILLLARTRALFF